MTPAATTTSMPITSQTQTASEPPGGGTGGAGRSVSNGGTGPLFPGWMREPVGRL
jgi:hypothetical protein